MLQDDTLFIGVGAMLAIWALAWVADVLWKRHKKRDLWKHIRENRVPVDYDRVAEAVREANDPGNIVKEAKSHAGVGPPTQRQNLSDLKRLRSNVARIRVNGYDRAVSDRENKVEFAWGVTRTPYPKGTGEAKQWVRGYCIGANVRDIKRYYDAA